jgi:hypothetical protein
MWIPLHAAAANGHAAIVRYLMDRGADTEAATEVGETALDLVDGEDYETMAVLLHSEIRLLTKKKQSVTAERREPAWVRRESLQGEEKDTRRKGSAWVGKEKIPEEEEDIPGEGSNVGKDVKGKKRMAVTVDMEKPVFKNEGGEGKMDKQK